MITLQNGLLIFGPLIGYLLGSIPFGLIIGLGKGVDIRKVGSGNIGATNLGRTLGARYFWYAFVLDALKGLLPTLVVSLWAQSSDLPLWLALVTGIATLCGHIFPIYLKFKGGKGVATSFGVVLGIWPVFTLAGVAAGMVFLIVFLLWGYISLASIIASASFTGFVVVLGWYGPVAIQPPNNSLPFWIAAATLLTMLIIIKHRSNIRRLLAGTEPKYGKKRTET